MRTDRRRDGFGKVGYSDRPAVVTGEDDPDPPGAEDLGQGVGSGPQTRREGDSGFPEGGGGQVGVDEHFGHGHFPALLAF
jgi:hypothetical protein